MKKPTLFISFIALIVVFLSIVQIIVSNRLSTTGIQLAKLDDEISFYDDRNLLLKEKLLTDSSLHHIVLTANKIGFVEEKSKFFLTSPLPLAAKP
ncbi:MAG: hypothetical protein Q8P10_00400 [bacterium]|nr:hypothetical protein [bacterium]